jgi:hypothetical protein
MVAPDWTRVPLLSSVPAVILPVPSAVKEPITARKPDSVYPLRPKAYCPLRSDSLPESEQAAVALTVMLSDCVAVRLVVVSNTCTVNLNVLVAVGVPEMSPDEDSVENPVGRLP